MIVLGEQVKEIYSTERQVNSNNISVIYPSVDMKEFSRNEKKNFNKNKITVTYLGNLVFSNNGVDILLEAARIVCSQSDNIDFIFAGQPKTDKDSISSFDNYHQRIKFIYINNASQVTEIMTKSDILAHTRRYSLDSLSVQSKLAVYMANGKPIVATDFADYKYLIQDKKCGYTTKR